MTIRSFANKETAAIFEGLVIRRWPRAIQQQARGKLAMLDVALALDDLRVPPGNRLEKLKGGRAGCWSIRVDRQWRICFRWRDSQAWDVEIVDYR